MSEKNTPTSNTQSAPSPMEFIQGFHRIYSMPIRSFDDPTLSYECLSMRTDLITEEFAKLIGAVYGKRACAIIETATAEAITADNDGRNVTETTDALTNLIYVIYGMAVGSGVDLSSVLAEVQASDLSKLTSDGSIKLREGGKVPRGPNFFPSNAMRGLGPEAGRNASGAD